jgi:hypothetical protein
VDWQPIETAPKDGTHILLWWRTCPDHPSVGAWDVDEEFEDRPTHWPSPVEGWRCEGDDIIPKNQHDVTHWMPLPAPPTL